MITNSIKCLLIGFLVLNLSSGFAQSSQLTSKQVQKQCTNLCASQFEGCKKKCDNNCRRCSANAYRTAAIHYGHYINETMIEGGEITRDLNSYRDPLQCRKVSCDCLKDLNECFQGCTGLIKKRLQVRSPCI